MMKNRLNLKFQTLLDYFASYTKQDHMLLKSHALSCAFLAKYIKTPSFLRYVSKFPINVCLLITYRCTRRCQGCFFLDKLNQNHVEDMDLCRLKEIYSSPLFKTFIRVGLLGGDPLLNPHLFDIINFLKASGHIVTVTCNADLLTTKRANELKRAGLNLLILSYYKDNKEKIVEFIRSIRGIGFERRRIALACHSENIADIKEAYDLACEIGIPTMLPRYTYDFTSARKLSGRQKRQIWQAFRSLGCQVKKDGKVRFTPLEPYSYTVNKRPYCQNALMTYIIGLDNEISPCCQPTHKKWGTIYDYHVSERFKAAVFENKTIPAMCLQCPVLGGGNFL